MAGVSTPEMAAAVSNAGGLGSIGVGAVTATAAREMIRATRALTRHSINVNVFCHRPAIANAVKESAWLAYLAPHFERFNAQPPIELQEIYQSFVDDDPMMDMLIEVRPEVVSFHFGMPSQAKVDRLKEAGIVVIATATSLHEAELLEIAGIDAIVAQGYEAGGHRGTFDPSQTDDRLGTVALVGLLVNNLNTPIIGAGGIMDGADIVACLRLGADAVQLGTAFIDCPESSADNFYRSALHSKAASNTVMTRAISGRPARCLANLFTKIGDESDQSAIPDYPIAYHAGKSLNAAAKVAGEGGYGAQWAGQGAPRARSMPAAELVAQLESEMETAKKTCKSQ